MQSQLSDGLLSRRSSISEPHIDLNHYRRSVVEDIANQEAS
jgi:hypothetical protein